jgi:lipid-A-disaccharide synthase
MALEIFISAGEASGERYGALLIDALKERLATAHDSARFFGMGGARMESAGLEPIARVEQMAVMGLTEVVRHLPRIYGEYRRLRRAIRARRPSVAVLIDFPEIHFRLARLFHEMGVPVVYFVSPQLWAWKKYRLKLVERYIDRMLVIFPFEESFYREHGVQAEFVGHPLAEIEAPLPSRAEFAAACGLDPTATWIGLLPGSRAKEIADHLPTLLEAATRLVRDGMPEKGTKQFLLPLAPTLTKEQRQMAAAIVAGKDKAVSVHIVADARAALAYSRASVVASGTATVEAALAGQPFVVVYRVSALTFAIAKRIVKVEHIAMANLIAGKRAVPELIQSDFTAANIARELSPLLDEGPPRQTMLDDLAEVRARLRHHAGDACRGAIDRVAAVTLEAAQTGVKPDKPN